MLVSQVSVKTLRERERERELMAKMRENYAIKWEMIMMVEREIPLIESC